MKKFNNPIYNNSEKQLATNVIKNILEISKNHQFFKKKFFLSLIDKSVWEEQNILKKYFYF